jgi:hypothetical protein
MARMIPAYPDADTPGSERRVFECLSVALPDRWTVFHARRFTLPSRHGEPTRELELDFLVLAADRGLLGIEVKGGAVGRDADGWYSVAHDKTVHRIKDPGHQVQHTTHAIADYLRHHPRFAGKAQPAFGWSVCFPDGHAPRDLGPDLPRAAVLDAADLEAPWTAINRVLDATLGTGTAFGGETMIALTDVLAPRFSVTPSLSVNVAHAEASLVRLTTEQMRILDYLAFSPRLGITGAAGTGKTLVAMERAARLAAEGQRVLLLCFNKGLAQHLRQRARGFTVSTFHSYCRDCVERAGIAALTLPGDAEALQRFYNETAPQQLLEALPRLPDERYDAVIVDEGQDFAELWWVAIEELLRDRAASSLWVFYDPKQDIFGRDGLHSLRLQPAELPYVCRNSEAIARFSHAFIGSEPRLLPGTPPGTQVETVCCDTVDDMREAVRKALHRLGTAERFAAERIVVLSPRSAQRSQLCGRTFGNFRLVESPTTAGEIRYASLQSFKGLETDALIVAEVDRSHQTSSPTNLYVATSRAKHVLVFVEFVPAARPEGTGPAPV